MSVSGLITVGDTVDIAYTCYGSKSQNAILLCPGLGATQLGFQADAEFLVSQGRYVVCFDLRGHGKSGMPETLCKEQFTIEKLAEDVIALIHSLDIKCVDFVGNSLGGVVGLAAIGKSPKLFRSLITFGTTYELNFPSIVVPIQYLMFKLVGKKRLPGFIAKRGSKKAGSQVLIKAQYSNLSLESYKMIAANIYRYNYLDVVDRWHGSVLMIKGCLDAAINKNLASTLKAMEKRENFKLVEIPDAGHFTNLDAPEKVQTIIEGFIKQLEDV